MTYAEMTDDELRVEVAKRSWLDGIIYPINTPNAIALLDGMVNAKGEPREWNIGVQHYHHFAPLVRLKKPQYTVVIFGDYPPCDDDVEATADTLARAACIAWLMTMEGKG